jgi:hypothetical protein
MNYDNDKLNEIYRDTWPNLGWAQKDMKSKFKGNYQGPLYARHPDLVMTHEEMLEEAAKREAANKAALESLGIDYESFGQKPWNEGDLDYEAPNGDYIKNYPLINRVEVIGKNGREYVQYDCSNVQVSMQDQGRTLKVFLS